jgi:hypothetical protein
MHLCPKDPWCLCATPAQSHHQSLPSASRSEIILLSHGVGSHPGILFIDGQSLTLIDCMLCQYYNVHPFFAASGPISLYSCKCTCHTYMYKCCHNMLNMLWRCVAFADSSRHIRLADFNTSTGFLPPNTFYWSLDAIK